MSVVSPFGLLLTAWERLNPGNGAARSEIASLLGLEVAQATTTERKPRERVLEPSPIGLENEQESRPHEDRKPTRSEVVANWMPAEEDAKDTPLLGSESLDLSQPTVYYRR
jgi:hypothetical protein